MATKKEQKFPTYKLEPDTTYTTTVGKEVEFKTDSEGKFTPKNEAEDTAARVHDGKVGS